MPDPSLVDRSAKAYGGYKYQWARYVAQQSLDSQSQILASKIKRQMGKSLMPLPAPEGSNLQDFAKVLPSVTFGQSPEMAGKMKVGIVGSGIAGLFTAALIDELNRRIPELEMEYDILEAGGKNRLGGRLYTARFEGKPENHQYYDVGAMRFPNNEVMDRTFRLFNFLDIKEGGDKCPRLVPYYMKDENKVCPTYFNHIRHFGKVDFKNCPDPYQVNEWLPKGNRERIDESVINQDPSDVAKDAIASFRKDLQDSLDELAHEEIVQGDTDKSAQSNDPLVSKKRNAGWEKLMKADFLTVREFFRRGDKIDGTDINGRGWNFNTIEWLETYALATGLYNESLAEAVLHSLDFDPPKGEEESNKYWHCIEGGAQLLPEKLASTLKKQPEFNQQVTAITTNLDKNNDGKNITLSTRTTMPDDWDRKLPFAPVTDTKDYFAVFNSTTLGALQKMDLSKAKLHYGIKQAIRSLRYDSSCKVAIQFKEMWWQQAPWNIKKGGLGKTDLPIRTCVYPSYNVHDNPKEKGVLLCSYTWAQDAQRVGTLIDPTSLQHESELKEIMLSNLAQLHAKPELGWPYEVLLDRLHELYITHHAHDWYHDPHMSGAYAYFGPGQFSQMWPQIILPNGWLFFIGEAASAHHGWVVGALESSVRAMYQFFVSLHIQAKKAKRPFEIYEKAMKFLEGPEDKEHPDWKLPFVGLPKEIPEKQIGTSERSDVQFSPEEGVDLSFVAAQVIASYFKLRIEVAEEEELTSTAVATLTENVAGVAQ